MTTVPSGLPTLPEGWLWTARVNAVSVTVYLRSHEDERLGPLGSTTVDLSSCYGTDESQLRAAIVGAANGLWESLGRITRVGADLGIDIEVA